MEYSTAWRCSIASTDPTLGGSTLKHEGRRQTDRRAAYAGSRLKLIDASGRSRLIRQPFSRNGENSPYGMLGGIVETSASFEARSAPRSYPTRGAKELLTLTLAIWHLAEFPQRVKLRHGSESAPLPLFPLKADTR